MKSEKQLGDFSIRVAGVEKNSSCSDLAKMLFPQYSFNPL